MTDEIINCNLNEFICVTLKMVSGEEIITPVDPESFDNCNDDILVLYDPFKIKIHDGLIVMTIWVIANSDNEQVISKDDIMVRAFPDEKFELLYYQLLERKYNMENSDEEGVMEIYDNKIISPGPDSIN